MDSNGYFCREIKFYSPLIHGFLPMVIGLPEDSVQIFQSLHDTYRHLAAIRSLIWAWI